LSKRSLFRLFFLIGYLIFSFSKGFDSDNKGSMLFIRNIGLQSQDINFTLKHCEYFDINKNKTFKCENENKYLYTINSTLKNNMELLFNKSLNGYSKISIHKNGIRITPDNTNIYHRNMPLFVSSKRYNSFKNNVNIFLSKISNQTLKLLKLSKQKENRLNPSFAFSIYISKIYGVITITKVKLKENIVYDFKLDSTLQAKFIINKLNKDDEKYEKIDDIKIPINKNISKKFKYAPKETALETIIDDMMQSSFIELGKKFSNKMNKYNNLDIADNESKEYIGSYLVDSFIVLGTSLKHFKVSSIGNREPKKYNENIPSFTFGYSKRIYDKYKIWLNTLFSVGKVEKIILKDSYLKTPYILDDTTFLSLDISLLKKIYINSSGLYIAPIFGLGISRTSSKKVSRFIGKTTVTTYNTFVGGEFGYNKGFNHEISTSINYNVSYSSLTKDNSDITEKYGGYKTSLDKGLFFELFYKYHF
jgi:hypothetical protein